MFRKATAEHRRLTFRLRGSGFVLDHVPMFDQNAILDPENVGCNPICGRTESAEPAMDHHPFAFRQDQTRLVPERHWNGFDQVEESFSSGLDMSTVLNVIWRPKPFRCSVIAPIEEGVEGLQDQRFILFWNRCSFAVHAQIRSCGTDSRPLDWRREGWDPTEAGFRRVCEPFHRLRCAQCKFARFQVEYPGSVFLRETQ